MIAFFLFFQFQPLLKCNIKRRWVKLLKVSAFDPLFKSGFSPSDIRSYKQNFIYIFPEVCGLFMV
ncbi:hypothetical protein HMP0721_2131 [Pseudoramibacter alactolyticus ATCC 23263]|uniref:Uncharacterized protein n=1 Tax=Pseudoramibacter alactolyticus ATCC 23263 TaxID=887929 RepID=E6MJE6_9FIRM|nr:hypothetical protein HMP0721_2131 [Pseudoramibacter alactolyticus ATCC 23263]